MAIAGYTNAGKSTLLNRLTDAGVLVQDALFATLDPTVRRARAADGREYTLTDTVGFVRNLPTQLVEAFRSTLEEVGQADVILHVVDAAHPDPVSQVQAVRAVIDTIEGASDIPELIALNKADLASPEQIALLRTVFPGAVPLSAHTGWGVDALRAALEDMLPRPRVAIDVILPYSAGSLVHRIHEEGEVDREEYVETGTRIVARVDEALAALIGREAVGGTVGNPAGSGQGAGAWSRPRAVSSTRLSPAWAEPRARDRPRWSLRVLPRLRTASTCWSRRARERASRWATSCPC